MRKLFYCILAATLLALPLGACATPGSGSGGAAGGAQPATNVAQTVGNDQAAVPSQSYGGDNNWTFASQTDAAVLTALIELAKTQSWSADDFIRAAGAMNGAPENVTITTEGNVQAGNADAAGVGTGGGGNQGSGGGGTVTPR